MIEILQLLFATAKDQNVYLNQEHLIQELVIDYQFARSDVEDALAWFAPVIAARRSLNINPDAIRSVTNWEEKHLPQSILKQIFAWEQTSLINLVEREILLDRLAELSLDWAVEADDLQGILEGLVYHFRHYPSFSRSSELTGLDCYQFDNFTIH